MKLFVEKLTEEFAKQVCAWKYEGEYSVYDFASWEFAVRQRWSITDPRARESQYRAVTGGQEELIGFFRMSEDEEGKIEIGLGLRPDRCGQGIGKHFVRLITRYALNRHPGRPVYMEVRTFNKRAVKCYEACGYKVVLRHRKQLPWGSNEYFLMEYQDT
jgi:ribosomal-protein-alanine N-acetyltransferase